jgi:GNAT superfamily N-acetyltransferase
MTTERHPGTEPAGRAGMSLRLLTRTYDVFNLLSCGHPTAVLQRVVGGRLNSRTLAFGLCRDLNQPHTAPAAQLPLEVRPLGAGDDLSMLDIEASGLPSDVVLQRLAQRRLLAAELPRCWVAIAPDGKVCYMQWLVAPRDNARIRAVWGDLFPPLAPDEALLEGAYTGDAYRGQGIMAHAMSRIAEAAREFGARWVKTYVGQGNVASLKGCKKAGFVPCVERSETWWLLRRRVLFTDLPAGTSYPFP